MNYESTKVIAKEPFKKRFIEKMKDIRRGFRHITVGWVLLYIFMILLAVFCLLPIVYMISSSLKPYDELFYYPPRFFVEKPTLDNFTNLFTALSNSTVPFTRYLFNSIVLTVSIVAGTCLVCSMGAYGLSKFNIPGKNIIFSVVIATLMFSPYVTRIPSFLVVSNLHLLDSYVGIIIVSVGASGNFFLMKQFIDQYPYELIEAARIDGAGEFRIFWQIVMPAQKPALSALIVFSFVGSWNDYFTPLIFISKQSMRTLPLALQSLAGGAGAATLATAGIVAAASLLMTLPTIVIFVIMQRKVIETMTYAGIKG